MLQQLYIQNYVIIDELVFKPGAHLNIITGETGAGKSILLGALGLILGERADGATLRDKEKKCVVEAHFDVKKNAAFQQALAAEELDYETTCIIRREIAINGKSRSFINDTPVNLSVLAKLTYLLVDLHQQFGHLALKEDHFQMEVLDAVAANQALLKNYTEQFSAYRKITKQIAEQKALQLQAQKEADYKQFLFDELEQASFGENEIEEAEVQLRQLNHAERIINVLQQARTILTESEQPLVDELRRTVQQLQSINEVMNDVEPLHTRIHAAYEELKDVANELEALEHTVSLDPEKLVQLQERVDLGYKLLKKHGFQTTHELMILHRQLADELQSNQSLTEHITGLEREKEGYFIQLTKTAKTLSQRRNKELPQLETQLNELLKLVGMPNAKLKIELTSLDQPDETGTDNVIFLLDANKSGTFSPVYKAASGGEMSRMMLCIKSLTAKAMALPTLIFDEVDTGISGEAAKQVGILLKELAVYHQVICITHQPQVAAKADTHFYVYKEGTANEHLTAKIRSLDEEERIQAIAQMIGGEKPSDAAVRNARELVTF